MYELCMPIFRPLSSLVWEENEVTYVRVTSLPIPIQNFSTYPSLCLGGINQKFILLNLCRYRDPRNISVCGLCIYHLSGIISMLLPLGCKQISDLLVTLAFCYVKAAQQFYIISKPECPFPVFCHICFL